MVVLLLLRGIRPRTDKRLPPLLQILVEIHISDVLKINDRDFSITFSLYFNVQWTEPRLHLNPSFYLNR